MVPPQDDSNPFAAPQAQVTQQAGQRPPLASLGQRFLGMLIDQMLPMLAGLGVLLATGDFQNLLDGMESEDVFSYMSGTTLGALGIMYVIFLLVQLYLVLKERQTIGKRIVGSRVHRTAGEWVDPGRYILLRGLVPGLLYGIPFIGFLLVIVGHLTIFGADRRCLHDYIADTVVLKA